MKITLPVAVVLAFTFYRINGVIFIFQVSEVYSKELKGAISALASLQGHLLIASGPKIILHKWTGTELNGIAFFDGPPPPLYVVSLNTVCAYILQLCTLYFLFVCEVWIYSWIFFLVLVLLLLSPMNFWICYLKFYVCKARTF